MIKTVIKGSPNTGKTRYAKSLVDEDCYINVSLSTEINTRFETLLRDNGFKEDPVFETILPKGDDKYYNHPSASKTMYVLATELEKREGKTVCIDDPFTCFSKEGFRAADRVLNIILDKLNIIAIIVDHKHQYTYYEEEFDLDKSIECKVCGKKFIDDDSNIERCKNSKVDYLSGVKSHWSYDKRDNTFICGDCCKKQGLPVD